MLCSGNLQLRDQENLIRKIYKSKSSPEDRAQAWSIVDVVIESAGSSWNTPLLEASICYGSLDKIKLHWSVIESKVSDTTFGLLANYWPSYAVERILLLDDKARCQRSACKIGTYLNVEPATLMRFLRTISAKLDKES